MTGLHGLEAMRAGAFITPLSARVRALRRRARCVAAVVVAALCVGPAYGSQQLLVTVGEVTATTAVLWGRTATGDPIVAELTAPSPAKRVRALLRPSADRDHTAKAVVGGLEPATPYRYRVSTGTESVDGRFVTAPADRDPRPVVFAWSGDLGGGSQCRRMGRGYPIFRAMGRRNPDFFVFLGDTVYADHRCAGAQVVPGADFEARSLSGFQRKHRYNREDPAVQDFFRATAVYAIWDDHEVRNNFAAPTEPLAPAGLRAFLDYWPIMPQEPTRLYRRVRWGGLLELFILDTRQYRSDDCLDSADKTMLGDAQREWLLEGVAASTAVWKIVVSSVPFSIPKGGICGDSWAPRRLLWLRTGFPTERDALLDAWRERRVRNLVVLAADVHYADIIRHTLAPALTFHELIAGPLAASLKEPATIDPELRAERLFAQGGLNNFGEIAIDQGALTVRIIDEEGRVLATRTIDAER